MSDVPFMFGSQVRTLRELRGWTQEQLAARLTELLGVEVHPLKVGRTEGGVRPVPLGEAMAFAAALDTTLDALLSGTTDPAFAERVAVQMEAGRLVQRLCDALEEEQLALNSLTQLLDRRAGLRDAVLSHPSLTVQAMALLKSAVAGRAGDGAEKEGRAA